MDFPEVWSFQVKEHEVKPVIYESNNTVGVKLTAKLPVVKMVSILLPETDTDVLKQIIKDSDYYSTESFKISDILTKNFIDGFLKTGKLYCATSDPTEFVEGFLIVDRKLFVKLQKETVYSVNSVELCKFKSKLKSSDEFFVYEIDLLQDKLQLSKLREELQEMISETSVNFMWTPNSEDFCPSSIAKYFSDLNYNVKLLKNKQIERPEYGLKFPTIVDEFSFPGIAEYVGMALLGCVTEETDFSSYRIPQDHIDIGKGKVIHCKGFITPKTIQKLTDESRRILKDNPEFPWIAISLIIPEKPAKILLITNDKIYSL